MSRAATLALALCLGTASVRAGDAQESRPLTFLPRTPNLTRTGELVDRAVRWAQAVMRHVPGVRDAAVDEAAGWDQGALNELAVEAASLSVLIPEPDKGHVFYTLDGGAEVGYPRAQLRKLIDTAKAIAANGLTEDDFLARALLLHTDVVLLTGAKAPVLHVADGRAVGVERPPDHWLLMRGLASLIDRNSPRQGDVHLWYRATLAQMLSEHTWHARHADTAAALRPVDATLLFLAGCVHEDLASAMVQASLRDADEVTFGFRPGVRTMGEELGLAASLLKRAIELNPDLIEARIHYGRVQTIRDHADEAIGDLERAAADAPDPLTRYYALLFLGDALGTTDRIDAARAAYEQARHLFPRAPSPQLGLSELFHRQGDRAAATRAAETALDAGDESVDPWHTYIEWAGHDATALLAAARARLATPMPSQGAR